MQSDIVYCNKCVICNEYVIKVIISHARIHMKCLIWRFSDNWILIFHSVGKFIGKKEEKKTTHPYSRLIFKVTQGTCARIFALLTSLVHSG